MFNRIAAQYYFAKAAKELNMPISKATFILKHFTNELSSSPKDHRDLSETLKLLSEYDPEFKKVLDLAQDHWLKEGGLWL